jgi:ubiquinone/menaquinone biosynthesis C-methylase UbiE
MTTEEFLKRLYEARFSPKEVEHKNKIWKVFCDTFLSKYVSPNDTVVDLAAGYCEFINNIKCKTKIAVDINPAAAQYKNDDVKLILNDVTKMVDLPSDSVDVVFTSSFFEHLLSKDDLLKTLLEVRRVLKTGGRLLIVMPNIRYSYKEYWDFFDHTLPVSHKALEEGLRAMGYDIETVYPRFVPYTTKSRFPKALTLVRWYLKMPFLFPLFGKQLFISAKKAA